MSTNIFNVDPYLRMHWHFTDDKQLFTELARSFNEIAICTNMRVIGSYAVSNPAVTGKQYFIAGGNRAQQSIRQIYPFTSAGNIAHNINTSNFGGFVQIYGTVQDTSGNWYPLPLVSSTDVTAQISLQVTGANIVISAGADAISIKNGFCILEWLSNP